MKVEIEYPNVPSVPWPVAHGLPVPNPTYKLEYSPDSEENNGGETLESGVIGTAYYPDNHSEPQFSEQKQLKI